MEGGQERQRGSAPNPAGGNNSPPVPPGSASQLKLLQQAGRMPVGLLKMAFGVSTGEFHAGGKFWRALFGLRSQCRRVLQAPGSCRLPFAQDTLYELLHLYDGGCA